MEGLASSCEMEQRAQAAFATQPEPPRGLLRKTVLLRLSRRLRQAPNKVSG